MGFFLEWGPHLVLAFHTQFITALWSVSHLSRDIPLRLRDSVCQKSCEGVMVFLSWEKKSGVCSLHQPVTQEKSVILGQKDLSSQGHCQQYIQKLQAVILLTGNMESLQQN